VIPNAAQNLLLNVCNFPFFRLEQEMDITSPGLYQVTFTNEIVRSPGEMITQNPIRDALPDGPAWKKLPSGKALSADYTYMPVIPIKHKSPSAQFCVANRRIGFLTAGSSSLMPPKRLARAGDFA
jgi:hypothetical protein